MEKNYLFRFQWNEKLIVHSSTLVVNFILSINYDHFHEIIILI